MLIHFVTNNKNKLREFENILGFALQQAPLNLDEIQAIEVEKVVDFKARQAFEKIKKPLIVEDTGLYFDAWNGLPGALAKWFDKSIGYGNLCSLLGENRRAKAQTVIGYFNGENYQSFTGEVFGKISDSPRGTNHFGWDIIFIPEGHSQTFAEMGLEEKNKISMRRIALEKFKQARMKKLI